MVTVNVTIKGAERLAGALIGFPEIAKPFVERAMEEAGKIMLRHSQILTTASMPQKTGRMRHAFKFAYTANTSRLYVDPREAPYAIFVHEGTKPHEIRARRARALRFQWVTRRYVTAASGRKYYKKTDRGIVFFKSVHHPGTKAHPFMQAIAENSRPEITQVFAGRLADIIQAIAKK